MISSAQRPPFRWKHYFLASGMLFLTLELAGVPLLILGVLIRESLLSGYNFIALLWEVASDWTRLSRHLALGGLRITWVPALIHSLAIGAVSCRLGPKERLSLGMLLVSAVLAGALYALGTAGWRMAVPTISNGLEAITAAAGGGAALLGTWVVHRYFRMVERAEG